MITKEGFDAYLEFKDALEDKVHEILMQKCNIESDGLSGYLGYIDKIDFENGNVEIETIEESRCSCCRDETHYYNFPISYLFDEKWIDDAKEKVACKRIEQEQKERKEQERRKTENEEMERAEFERLRAKFGW